MLGTWCRLAWAALVIYPMVIIREQWEKLNQVYPYIQTLSIEDIFLLRPEGQQAPEPRLQRGFKSDKSVVSFKSTLIEWKLPLDWSQAVFIRYNLVVVSGWAAVAVDVKSLHYFVFSFYWKCKLEIRLQQNKNTVQIFKQIGNCDKTIELFSWESW